NGGFGAAQTALKHPDLFQGVIFLSPGMTPEIIDGPQFQAAWQERPILVITGALDRRIPLSYVETRVETLRKGGVGVSLVTYPEEDHFLLFSQPESVMNDIKAWLKRN
ncbi:MAG: prolyl oligopeptidase family serine peptidase, partial [Chloroflexota bacterium]